MQGTRCATGISSEMEEHQWQQAKGGFKPSALGSKDETVIKGSRRPDGTYRKDIRRRPGYVPQDEVPKYVSKGKQWAMDVPKCPGFEESEDDKNKGKTKAQKKNDKRKAKRQDKAVEDGAAPKDDDYDNDAAAAATAAAKDALQQQGGREGARPDSSAQPCASITAVAADPVVALEKQARTIRKKLKQCDEMREKAKTEARELLPEQKEKLTKEPTWRDELAEIEKRLAQLKA